MVSKSKAVREILFRGKREDNGSWIVGSFHKSINDCYIIPLPVVTSKSKVIPETVGQFTGRTDKKNGKRIFEDDIVCIRYEDSNGAKYCETRRVFYDSEDCRWYPLSWGETCDRCDFSIEITSIEILGNIHDNPELLEGCDG